MTIETILFSVYPYLALTVFLLGSWLRFDYAQYTWKSDSSQFFSKRYMLWASNLFHVGILMLFFGHAIGLLTPHAWFLALGVSDLTHQWVAIGAGTIFGSMTLIGGLMLLARRILNRRVRRNSRFMDFFILSWLVVTAAIGLATIPVSIHHADSGDAGVMLALANWAQAFWGLKASAGLLTNVNTVFLIHLFFGMTVFLLFPFSRLVHIWSAPLPYLVRAYQIVRSKRIPQA